MIHLRSVSPRKLLLCCSLLLCCETGCSRQQGASREEHHHDEHEHLVHFVPAHKPAGFSELVDQLSLRIPELAGEWMTPADTRQETRRQELADVIGWIPELAADSELKKTDFETAAAAAKILQSEFEKQFPISGSTKPSLQTFESALKSLRALVESSQEKLPAL